MGISDGDYNEDYLIPSLLKEQKINLIDRILFYIQHMDSFSYEISAYGTEVVIDKYTLVDYLNEIKNENK